jgi:hypothetical protein
MRSSHPLLLLAAFALIAFAGAPKARPPVKPAGSSAATGKAGSSAKAAAVDRVASFSTALAKGDPAAVCGKGMLCRALDGAGCDVSKDFFSACYVLCGRDAGFRESHCMNNAVKAHAFDLGRGVYTRGDTVQDEPPAAHLARQIVKAGDGNAEVKSGLCSVCGAVRKAPEASRREMLGASAASFEAACKHSCD